MTSTSGAVSPGPAPGSEGATAGNSASGVSAASAPEPGSQSPVTIQHANSNPAIASRVAVPFAGTYGTGAKKPTAISTFAVSMSGNGGRYKLTFFARLTSNEVPLSGETITFTLSGLGSCEGTTHSGDATCVLSSDTRMLHSIYTAAFHGSAQYDPSESDGELLGHVPQ